MAEVLCPVVQVLAVGDDQDLLAMKLFQRAGPPGRGTTLGG